MVILGCVSALLGREGGKREGEGGVRQVWREGAGSFVQQIVTKSLILIYSFNRELFFKVTMARRPEVQAQQLLLYSYFKNMQAGAMRKKFLRPGSSSQLNSAVRSNLRFGFCLVKLILALISLTERAFLAILLQNIYRKKSLNFCH